MGLLRGSSVYLVGPVDHSADPHKWRRDITNELLLPLGVKVYDPLVKPSWFTEKYDTDISHLKDYKKWLSLIKTRYIMTTDTAADRAVEAHSQSVWNNLDAVHRLCLRMANDCNFMIVHLPKEFTAGSFQEIEIAARAGKPILFHLPDGMDSSTWLPVQIYDNLKDYAQNCFTHWHELYDKIKLIDQGDASVDNLRWIFLSYFNDKDVNHEPPGNNKV